MPDINEKFRAFVDKNKPIILGCKDTYATNGKALGVMDKVKDYQVLKTLNNGDCSIFVPKESANQTNANQRKNQKGVRK